MDDSPESDQPRERVVRRAEQLAVDAEEHVPSWLRAGDPEARYRCLSRCSRPWLCKWPSRRATRWSRAAITVDNTLSAVLLDARIISGEVSNKAAVLLGSGAAIFVTNIIVFGIWYWELDRGGPFARHAGERPYPDFMFPR
jgi:hypothetical protein